MCGFSARTAAALDALGKPYAAVASGPHRRRVRSHAESYAERMAAPDPVADAPAPPPATALQLELVTSLANPKLAVFFVALFPQFIPAGAPVLPSALAMAATIVALDLVWYSALAYGVARTRRAFLEGPWQRRVERLTGGVLVALGVRLALERR